MTTIEHLNKIKAKCEDLVSIYDNAEPHTPLPAVAGWRSTIAAIDLCLANLHRDFHQPDRYSEACDNDGRGCNACINTEKLEQSILSAWPEELLN